MALCLVADFRDVDVSSASNAVRQPNIDVRAAPWTPRVVATGTLNPSGADEPPGG